MIKKRKQIEKEYTGMCIHFGYPLPEKGGRMMSVSPTSYFYQTGVNPRRGDVQYTNYLHNKCHYGIRLKIEKEVYEILQNSFVSMWFFQLKDKLINMSHDELNSYLHKNECKRINVNKFNRLKKLFRKWVEESANSHYKPHPAQRRISRRLNDLR